MSPLALLLLQISASFAALGLLVHTLVWPRLRSMPRRAALSALLWVHVPRFIPLGLLAPGQTSPEVSMAAVQSIAWGDFLSAAAAFVALLALHRSGSLRWLWIFVLVSSVDIVGALTVGLGSGVYLHPLGVAWYVLTLYVPVVCVSQLLIVVIASTRPGRSEGRQP